MATIGSRTYSPGIMSGAILLAEPQLLRMHVDYRKDFEPIRVRRDVTMYRYKNAPEPYTGKRYDPVAEAKASGRQLEATEDWDMQFSALVETFVHTLEQAPKSLVFLVEGDDDFDFTYGAFCTAVAEKGFIISDWLFTKDFGNVYCIQHISNARAIADDEDDDLTDED